MKRQTADSVGQEPAESVWPASDFETRGGHIGEVGSNWDNGFYTCAEIIEYQVNFLVDSGSTAYPISKTVFDQLQTDN